MCMSPFFVALLLYMSIRLGPYSLTSKTRGVQETAIAETTGNSIIRGSRWGVQRHCIVTSCSYIAPLLPKGPQEVPTHMFLFYNFFFPSARSAQICLKQSENNYRNQRVEFLRPRRLTRNLAPGAKTARTPNTGPCRLNQSPKYHDPDIRPLPYPPKYPNTRPLRALKVSSS